jgi:outer membrane protein OmpA-like peptidoglycan-associated protein
LNMMRFFVIGFIFSLSFVCDAQRDTIRLKNPSFEDTPKRGGDAIDGIAGWFDCGKINFPSETPPDIHPSGFWENNLPASDKKTYLGMVVRDNYTYESVSVRLDSFLKAGYCYKFSIHLAKAEKYISGSRTTGDKANYNTPAVLRIWGGSGYCNERELLAESVPVNNTSWQINTFEFRPKTNIRSITLSAFYKTPVVFPYNGNILVDGASAIVRIACPGEPPLKDIVKSNLPPHKRKKSPAPSNEGKSTVVAPKETSTPVVAYKPKVLEELTKDKIREGQTIEIKNLTFKADSATIDNTSYVVLDDIYGFLMTNKNVIIEIGGHTNNVPSEEYCNRLSTERAKSVAEYLVNKGADPTKIQFKGYGKKRPVADNKTAYGRAKNQRVEIKILSLNS